MRDLWGKLAIRQRDYYVFHDESLPAKRWLIIGLLFVPSEKIDKVRNTLVQIRKREDYFGEIHFSELPRSFKGKWSNKARVAKGWMDIFPGLAQQDWVYFSALIVDRYNLKRNAFPERFHEYNRFTAMALKAGIAWHLGPKGLDKVVIHFVSDAKSRISRPEQGIVDNFEEYLPYRAELDAFLSRTQKKPYPMVEVSLTLADSSSEDLLQLCDLLLGATQTALVASSHKPTKRVLGRKIIQWHKDTQKPPWEQAYGLHRKFNLWLFPDKNGAPSGQIPFQLQLNEFQLRLF